MKIVFVITSFWAYGELLIASRFANALKNQHDILFLIPPSHKETVKKNFACISLIPNSRNINRIIISEIREKFHPDLVILSDFLNYAFADKHYGLLNEDLELFGCKIATFDNFDWNLKRRCMDTYGFVSDIPKRIDIDLYGPRIIPCPLGNPELSSEYEYRFSMVDNDTNYSIDDKALIKKSFLSRFNLEEKPIILVSYAKWQENYAQNGKIDRFIDVCNKLFDKLIIELAKDYIVISIGEKRATFENVHNIVMLQSLPTNIFNQYVGITDLYIGKNITSTSMINIVMAGIPCVNIVNSYSKVKNRECIASIIREDISDMANEYRYMMYPVGWYEFLKPLFTNNPYSDVVTWCELFDFSETLKVCKNIIQNRDFLMQHSLQIKNLKTSLGTLQSPNEIVTKIIEGK